MIKFQRRWTAVQRINHLQRKIILNSIMYYEYDLSLISDEYFNSISRQLVDEQSRYSGDLIEDTMYGYMMHDFDGSTGFDLYSRLNDADTTYLTELVDMQLSKHKPKKEVKIKRRLF